MTFFLGAVTPNGFSSLYHDMINLQEARVVYILKGGPGCGKSTLMRRVAAQWEEETGRPVQRILCASDPGSLDAVVFPDIPAAIVDGTPPHAIEPTAPYVIEQYVNLGAYYNNVEELASRREDVLALIRRSKQHRERAVRCLCATASLEDELFSAVSSSSVFAKINRRARGVISREIGRTRGLNGTIVKRFLSAFTPDGVVCRFDSARAVCDRVYEISDSYGLSPFFLNPIYVAAAEAGHDIIACYSPMDPERLEHVLLPSLDLAFVTSSPLRSYDAKADRRVRLDACVDSDTLRAVRTRLKFMQKTRGALTEQATDALLQAKAAHLELETIYNPYVDFKAVSAEADRLAHALLTLYRKP